PLGGDGRPAPDPPQPQRLVGPGEVAVRGVEVVVGLVVGAERAGAPVGQLGPHPGPVVGPELQFDFEHVRLQRVIGPPLQYTDRRGPGTARSRTKVRPAVLVTVCKAGDIPDGAAAVVTVGKKDIAVFHTEGQYY